MFIAEFNTDLVSARFETDLADGRNTASLRWGLKIIPSAAASQQVDQAEAV